MFVAFRLALKSLFANPIRTGLTTLGIIIGIGAVVLVLSAGAGFRSLINTLLETYGTNTLFIETRVPPTTKNRNAGSTQADFSRASSPVAITTFKNFDLDEIRRLPNVVNNYGMVVGQNVISYRDVVKNVLYYGASSERFEIDKGTLKTGRFYTTNEDRGASQIAILGNNLANDLFGEENPIGKFVKVGNLNFQVIGVYNPRGSLGQNEDDALFIPLITAQKKLLGIDYLLVGIVQVKDSNLAESTAEDIRQLLRNRHNINDPNKDDFVVQTQTQSLQTFNTIFGGVTALLVAIAAISLIVGGVGIMNIMYVVVTERTAEIGLKKALGAKNSDILYEFLIEAILVTIIGGAFGISGGAFLAWVVAMVARANNLQWVFVVPFYAILLGLGVAAAIGLIFGVLPARSAAKLDPVEAMRYE